VGSKKGTVVLTGFCCVQENFEPDEDIRDISPLIPQDFGSLASGHFPSASKGAGSSKDSYDPD
jgi:hypothetical protein